MATIKGIVESASLMFVVVTTGSEPRPATTAKVMWIGGTSKPSNMANSDIWLKESTTGATAPQFVTTTLNTMTQNVAFSQALVLNGTTPMSFTVTAGSLPAGLTIHSTTGNISGTPTSTGAYSFSITAVNAQGNATQSYSGQVTASAVPPTITTTTLSTMIQGTPFSQTLNATGTSPLSWTISGGLLPAGLSLNSSTGTISGTPTGTGSYSFTITATNSAGSDPQGFTGDIGSTGTAPEITTTSLTAMVAGTAFSQTIGRTGSTPMTWGLSTGTVPSGLAINSSTGVISGTPSAAGSYSFTVQATNAFGSDTQIFTGTIGAATTANEWTIHGIETWPLTSYTDADAGAWISAQYYQWTGATASPAGSKIVGAKLYIPSGSAHIGKTWRAALLLHPGTVANQSGQLDYAQYDVNGTKVEGSLLTAGWNTIRFAAEYDIPAPGGSWFIGTQIADGVSYLRDETYTQSAVRNPDQKNFYLAEMPIRSWYWDDMSGARWHGIDCIVKIPNA
jgi:hypothetical protein